VLGDQDRAVDVLTGSRALEQIGVGRTGLGDDIQPAPRR
jgi:hypothetical protein